MGSPWKKFVAQMPFIFISIFIFSIFNTHSRVSAFQSANATESTIMPTDENGEEYQEIASVVLSKANSTLGYIPPNYQPYEIANISYDLEWAFINLISSPLENVITQPGDYLAPVVRLAIANKKNNQWTVYLDNTEEFPNMLQVLPDSVLSPNSKDILVKASLTNRRIPTKAITQITSYTIPYLPWRIGDSWKYTQGSPGSYSHQNNKSAFDFSTPDGNVGTIHFADDGVLIGGKETCLYTQRSDGLILVYQHINKNDVNYWLSRINTLVHAKDPLGGTTMEPGCNGQTTGHHIHFEVITKLQGYWKDFDIDFHGSSINGWVYDGANFVRNSITAYPYPVRSPMNNEGVQYPSGYEFCSNEGSQCDFSGTATIAFGANGNYTYKNLSNGTDCNTSVFEDPVPGIQKSCYINGGGPPGYTYCAVENQRCSFSGVANVAYGASLKYIYKDNVSEGIDCNTATFGDDPIYGTAKGCYYKSQGQIQGKWTANYYAGQTRWWDNTNTSNPQCSESFGSSTYTLNKDYGTGAPCQNGMSADNWVGDYKSTIDFPSGNYIFWIDHDDGLKLWLNGTNIADVGDSGSYWVCPARYLSGNQNLWAMLREDGGSAHVTINWSTDTSICDPPFAFSKIMPYSWSMGVSTNPTISWNSSTKADWYEYCIDTSDNNTCDTNWVKVQTGTSAVINGLINGTTYYWQVRAVNPYSLPTQADGGTWWRFTTQPSLPGDFNKISPSNGSAGQLSTLTLTWGGSSGATVYEYCYDTSNDNACNNNWADVGNTTQIILSGLASGTTYYWQVRAINSGGDNYANNNAWWSFTTQAVPPGSFNKTTPSHHLVGVPTTLTLEWQQSEGADGYEYCLDATNDNNCDGSWINLGADVSGVLVEDLEPGTTYYWQVRATNSGVMTYSNNGVWWSFTTGYPQNLVQNGGFESGIGSPESWSMDAWDNTGTSFLWDSTQSHQGNRSVKISNGTPDDARWIQEVNLQSGTNYELSGWIRTENVAHSLEASDNGANLSILGNSDYWYQFAGGFKGTNDWTYVSMIFNSRSNTSIVIAARLGFYWGTTTGTAWFDDIRLISLALPSPNNSIYLPAIHK